ncbi:hypothetical protein FQN60_018672 [Etheostoma spectabile]|uniref:Uncharacterized protein n=1 Tax=Etheostoma spectabile TaxID=54343 RepID=A0A5J5CE51_9PERO|nr:hypothetical protein FQN60_018672 [Etheostoma spectabile]
MKSYVYSEFTSIQMPSLSFEIKGACSSERSELSVWFSCVGSFNYTSFSMSVDRSRCLTPQIVSISC